MTKNNPERHWDGMLMQGVKYTHKKQLHVEQLLSERLDINKN